MVHEVEELNRADAAREAEGDRYRERFRQMAAAFDRAYLAKEYGKAKRIYDRVLKAAEFLGISRELQEEVFGNWNVDVADEVEETRGWFDRREVDDCYKKCLLKLYESYETEAARRYGQAPVYYPQPRYPVRGTAEAFREYLQEHGAPKWVPPPERR